VQAFVRIRSRRTEQKSAVAKLVARRRITPSALLEKQKALLVCRDFLLRRRDSVHVTQAISQRLHHVRGEMWRLLHKKMKPAPVNFCQPAERFCHHACRAGAVIYQRHLAQECTGACSFHDEIVHHDIRLPFQQDIHFVAAFPFAKKKITGPRSIVPES
jgi:hypothetical protein